MDLLEREPFLRVLASEAASARQGDGRLVLISGESGIGKTALVEAFPTQTAGTGPALIWPAQIWLARTGGCGEPATGC